MTRKVEPGMCDVCGCAVVKPDPTPYRQGWRNGHFYACDELFCVRCQEHGGQGFDPIQVADDTVCGEFASDSDVPRKVWRR